MVDSVVKRKPSARKAREARLHGTYKAVEHVLEECVYCGRGGRIGDDHVPPLVAADWVKAERLLYPCCPICNCMISGYPLVCLERRAEYLLCRLRAEWARTKAGLAKRWTLDDLEQVAEGVKGRLHNGRQRDDCRCQWCSLSWRADPESKTPGLLRG